MPLNMKNGQPFSIGAVIPSQTKIPIPDPTALGLLAYSYPGTAASHARTAAAGSRTVKLDALPIQELQIRQLDRRIDAEKRSVASYGKSVFMNEYHGDYAAFVKGEKKKGDNGYFKMYEKVLAMDDVFLTNVTQAKRARIAFDNAWSSADHDKALDQYWYDENGLRRTQDDKGNIITEGSKEDKGNGYFTVGQYLKMGEIAPLGASGLVSPYNYGQHFKEGTANEEIDKLINYAKGGMREQLQSYADGTIGTTSSNEINLGEIPQMARKQLSRGALTEMRDNFNRDFPAGIQDGNGKAFKINGKDANRDQQFDIYMTNYFAERAGLAVTNTISKPAPSSNGGGSGGFGNMGKMSDEALMQSPYFAQVMSDIGKTTATVNFVEGSDKSPYGITKQNTRQPSIYFNAPAYYTAEWNKFYSTTDEKGVKHYNKTINEAFPFWVDASGTVHTGNELKQGRVLNFTGKIVYMPEYVMDPATGKPKQMVKRNADGTVKMIPYMEHEVSASEDDMGHGDDPTAFRYYKQQANGYSKKDTWHYSWHVGGWDKNNEANMFNDLDGRKLADNEYESFSKTRGVTAYAIKAYTPMNPANTIQGGVANEWNAGLYRGAQIIGGYLNNGQINNTRSLLKDN